MQQMTRQPERARQKEPVGASQRAPGGVGGEWKVEMGCTVHKEHPSMHHAVGAQAETS